jgi:hypothetical protein
MKRSTGKARRAWFWVGITLLVISILWWQMLLLVPGDIGGTIITGVVTTAVPIGIGIYSLRRSRKAVGKHISYRTYYSRSGYVDYKPILKDTGRDKVSRLSDWVFWIGLLLMLFGLPIMWLGLDLAGLNLGWDIAEKNPSGLGLVGAGLFPVLVGIWFLGITTKVTFNQPPGYITVTLGHIPVFLWFLRTRRISREDARNSTVTGYPLVKIVMKSGKELKLWTYPLDEVEPLAQRIKEFSLRGESMVGIGVVEPLNIWRWLVPFLGFGGWMKVKTILPWIIKIVAGLTLVATIFFWTLFMAVALTSDALQLHIILTFLVYIALGGITWGMTFGMYRGLVWGWKLIEKAVRARSKRIALAFLVTALLLVAFIPFGTSIPMIFDLGLLGLSFLVVSGGCLFGACLALNWVWGKVS